MNHNLLILGAGQYCSVVQDIAKAMECFDSIDLLDDNSANAVGEIKDVDKLKDIYKYAIVSIGNNEIRMKLLHRLKDDGFVIPTLIHPLAFISPSAKVGEGSIVEPFAVIQANASIGKGCIISATAVINHNARVDDGAHCDCGTIVNARGVVSYLQKVKCGTIIYSSTPDDGDIRYPEDYSAEVGI